MLFTLNTKDQYDCEIHFYYNKAQGAKLTHSGNANKEMKMDLDSLYAEKTIKASFGEAILYRNNHGSTHQLHIGLGDVKKFNHENLRQLTGHIYKKVKAEKLKSLSFPADQLPGRTDINLAVQALAEGFKMSSYNFDTFKESSKEDDTSVCFTTKKSSAALKKAIQTGETLAEAVNFSRWLGDCPGNYMNPTRLAEETKKAAKGTNLKVTAWDKKRIVKERMELLNGVSNGSAEEPRFIIMEYKGAAASKKPVCFVGKGLTFDCGGISIKPSAGMEEMKYDMCGGAAVIGTMVALAKLKAKVNAIAFVPASENMPGGAANKPGDIRKGRNGKTVEINNTDAEGRLILADALSYASEKKPAWIIDAATLTGAMMVSLGNIYTGFFSRDNVMADRLRRAANDAGELMWQMPLHDEHSKDMKGTYADLSNLAPTRMAGSSTAAAFLENFVDKQIPWTHVDVAGTAWHSGNRLSYAPRKGATGVMVRTFVKMAMNHR